MKARPCNGASAVRPTIGRGERNAGSFRQEKARDGSSGSTVVFKGTCLTKHGCQRPERGAIVHPSEFLVWFKITVGAICIQRCAFRNPAEGIRGNFSKQRRSEHYITNVAGDGTLRNLGIPAGVNKGAGWGPK